MKNTKIRLLLLCAIVFLFCFNAAPAVFLAVTEGQEVLPGESPAAEDAFETYVENCFGGRQSSGRRRGAKSAGTGLSGVDRVIYDWIAARLPQIAAGEQASTIFEIPVEELGFEQLHWTAEELGVEAIVVTDESGRESISAEAVSAASGKVRYDLSKIVNSLTADFPYELYWYEKTMSTSGSGYSVKARIDPALGEYVLVIEGSITIRFPVAEEFAAGEYEVDTEIGLSVQTAVENAGNIVAEHSGEEDCDKLRSYLGEICALVSYNGEAAGGETSYGNPWQIIWVFDGDLSTNVVCEGYAKAFKYLCDQSSFENGIRCITVTGAMDGGTGEGKHMWNIVHMEDGHNYLVDVTNCDGGSIGAPDLLFLAGTQDIIFEEEAETGYRFSLPGSEITYIYDAVTKTLFSAQDLVLSRAPYDTDDPAQKHAWDAGVITKQPSPLEEGIRTFTCIPCGETRTEMIPPSAGWGKDSEGWKYRKTDGTFATGWLFESGKWYYMNSAGIMQTGWILVGGKWYYMNSSGAMKTGWQYVGGKWYYMNSSGAMTTGWQYVGGKWYYMNSSGAMVTGWGYIGGKWYFFSSSGAMWTGWGYIGEKWYYFNSSGAMVTGRQKIGGKWYTFSSSGAMQ